MRPSKSTAMSPLLPNDAIHARAVGARRRRCVAVLLVQLLGRAVRVQRLPQLLAVGAVEREHRHPPVAARGGQEDAIPPDDRRRVPTARHGRPPEHVLRYSTSDPDSRSRPRAPARSALATAASTTRPRWKRRPWKRSRLAAFVRPLAQQGRRGSRGRRGRRVHQRWVALGLCASEPLRSAPPRSASSAPSASSAHP